jgi:hypothetical protein
MQYMYQLFIDESQMAKRTEAENHQIYGAYSAYTDALKEAGLFVAGDPLQPTATATCVTVAADGKTTVLDGPYPDIKEQLAGYYIVDVPDLDAAIAWAVRCPTASHGTVEVRPIMSM